MSLVPLLLLASTLHAGPEHALTRAVPNASPYSQFVADVVAGDGSALLVWHEPSSIYAARLGADGLRLDAAPIVLTRSQCGSRPAVARGDGRWVVVSCSGGNVVAQFVDDQGRVTAPVTVAPWPGPMGLAVAFDGTNYMVVWSANFQPLGAAVFDADGGIVKSAFVVDADPAWLSFDVAGTDSGFALAAIRRRGGSHTAELFRFTTTGQLTGYEWLDHTDAYLLNLDAIWDGGELAVAWKSIVYKDGGTFGPAGDVFLARPGQPLHIMTSGPDEPRQLLKVAGSYYVVMAGQLVRDDGSVLAVWSESGPGPLVVRGTVIGGRVVTALSFPRGSIDNHDIRTAVVDPSAPSHSTGAAPLGYYEPTLQTQPAVARNAHGEGLVAWLEEREDARRMLYVMMLDRAGRSVRREPVSLGESTYAYRPRVASDGTDFVVMWSGATVIVKRDGTVMPRRGWLLGEAGCVTWNGNEYVAASAFVTAPGGHAQPPRFQVREMRVTREGELIASRAISEEGQFLSVACHAGESSTLIAWSSRFARRIEGVIASDAGPISAPFRIAEARSAVTVAGNGDRFLVAWTSVMGTIERAGVSEHGTVTPVHDTPLVVGPPDPEIEEVALAPFEDGFALAWGRDDLRVLPLDRDGRAAGPQFDLSVTGHLEREAALSGGDSLLAIYIRDLNPPSLAPRWRVFTRTMTSSNPRRRAARH